MDEVTQQNSALVKENAATAKNLEQQSRAMGERVGAFKLKDGARVQGGPRIATAPGRSRAASKPVSGGARKPSRGPAANMQTALATAIQAEPSWKEF